MKGILSYTLYPLTLLVAGLAYFIAFKLTGLHLAGAYAGVSTSAVIIFSAERFYPLHLEWVPSKEDLMVDVGFYAVVVQVLFPLILYFLIMGLLELSGFKGGVILNLWPHQIPVIAQFFLLAISGEFFQYWWHRACHTYPILWPVHAPHHFPQKLYSWNTSRFHFLDKLVEFLFTILIFMIFGLSIEVFSYYYVFYAITGYIQHSNLEIKFGVFDYLIASGETHRFHHDSRLSASKCNYANNFVLFDLVFKTFKRSSIPQGPIVGVRSTGVPRGVWEENLYPLIHFKKHIDERIFQTMLKTSMELIAKKKVDKLRFHAKNPTRIQHQLLLQIVKTNKDTQFGIDHKFESIHTIEQFKKQVPIRDYEGHRNYIEQIFSGNSHSLSALAPHYFTKTSGTTGKPKYIPINKIIQNRYVNSQQVLSYSLYLKEPAFLDGEIFSVVGNAVEELLVGKWPCGSMSGKLYTLAHKSIKAKHIFQNDIALLNDSDQKYLYLAALALLSPNTTFYVSPNPSTLIKIFEVINSKKMELQKLLSSTSDPVILVHGKKCERAIALLNSSNNLTTKEVWPNLKIVSLWMGGSCSFLIPKVKQLIGLKVQLSELGYLCSEFYGTLPVGLETNDQIPTITDNFFEFIEKNYYESGGRETLELHELKLNGEYYIIVTTLGSFYRYNISDIVKVTGFFEKTPLIVFSQKGKGITNITGEKISEKQLVSFIEMTNLSKCKIDFFICLADQVTQSYKLYIESRFPNELDLIQLGMELDLHLKKLNIEYASKISDGRLKPIEIILVKEGTSEIYRNHCLSNGQRESQFKFLHLQYLSDVNFPFGQYIVKGKHVE